MYEGNVVFFPDPAKLAEATALACARYAERYGCEASVVVVNPQTLAAARRLELPAGLRVEASGYVTLSQVMAGRSL